MKIRDLFNYVHKLKECPFEDSELLVWLNEVEGLVHTKVFLLAPSEYKEITADDIDSDTFKLLIVGPHQKIYPAYLVAMIDFANGEYNRYANTLEMFNAHFTELQMWQRQYAGPADGECVFRGYYLSAYGIAKNRGVFNGSEEEWLASLKGDKGDSAYDIAVKLGYKGSEQEWIDHLAKAQSDAIDAARKSALEDIESNCGGNLSLIDSARETALQRIAEANEALSLNLGEYHSGLNDHYSQIAAELNSFRSDSIDEIAGAKTAAIDEIESTGSIFANALKGTASGEAVAITDVSPLEHRITVKVRGKNLIPFPYETPAGTSVTKSGVTFTTNADGSITLNGTATGNIFYSLVTPYLELQDGTYTLSGGYRNDTNRAALCIRNPGDTMMATSESKSANYNTQTSGNIVKEAYLYIYNGSTFDNITIYPQLEEGTIATAYAPYIGMEDIKVITCGKNMVPYPYSENGVTRAGVTYNVTDDGVIHANGTSTGSYMNVVNTDEKILYLHKGVAYRFSCAPTGGAGSKYYAYVKDAAKTNYFDYGDGATFMPSVSGYGAITIVVSDGTTASDLRFKPQLEIGTSSGEFKKGGAVTKHSPNANGELIVKSISPVAMIFTDAEGATVECEYNRDMNRVLDDTGSMSAVTGEPGQVLSFDADGNLAPMPLESLLENSGGISNTAKDLLLIILQNAVYANDQSANITALGEALSSSDVPDVPTAEIIPLGVVIGAVSRADGQKITYDPREVQYIRASINPIAVYVESGKTYKISLTDYSTYCINFQTFTYSTKGTDFTVVGGTQRIINGDFTRTYTSGWKNEDILYTADGTADIFIIQLAKGANHDETLTADDLVTLESMLTVTVE